MLRNLGFIVLKLKQEIGEKYEKTILGIDESAKQKLNKYGWPGNIRELRHSMERAVILSDGNLLGSNDFYLEGNETSMELGSQPNSLDEAEKLIISNALKRHKGNISNVAKELNIGRQTLYRKIEKYNIVEKRSPAR